MRFTSSQLRTVRISCMAQHEMMSTCAVRLVPALLIAQLHAQDCTPDALPLLSQILVKSCSGQDVDSTLLSNMSKILELHNARSTQTAYLCCRGGAHSSLMFCTNGVLLRMLTSGDGLKDVTHIVVDEIHERDKFADFLLIMLRDLLPSQPQLRLVLMSATLDAALFTNYFHSCPLMDVPGFTYPVQVIPLALHLCRLH